MTGTLRDRLAAVLGPGNDDVTAYAQADAVLSILPDIPRSPNEGRLAGTELAALNMCRGAVQDWLNGRPLDDCWGEICEALT